MAWAKLPTKWIGISVTAKNLEANQIEQFLDSNREKEGLARIGWKEYKTTGTGALMVLIALTMIFNLSKRKPSSIKDGMVRVTYDQITEMTELSRALVSRSLKLLTKLEILEVRKTGRDCFYRFNSFGNPGDWSQLPQSHLLEGHDHIVKFRDIHKVIRSKGALEALKLYMLILRLRSNNLNTASVSYDTISLYTGIRRRDISGAISLLVVSKLISVRTIHNGDSTDEFNHNTYYVFGLTADK